MFETVYPMILQDQAAEAFESEDGNKIFFDYLSRGYALFLGGEVRHGGKKRVETMGEMSRGET